jgi:hypothetical protein
MLQTDGLLQHTTQLVARAAGAHWGKRLPAMQHVTRSTRLMLMQSARVVKMCPGWCGGRGQSTAV